MRKFLSFAAGAAVAAVVCAGCYEYPKPPTATLGDSYTQRERDKADEMFKGIKLLTLADAQRLAIKNNPNYISAASAIDAARFRYYQKGSRSYIFASMADASYRLYPFSGQMQGNVP